MAVSAKCTDLQRKEQDSRCEAEQMKEARQNLHGINRAAVRNAATLAADSARNVVVKSAPNKSNGIHAVHAIRLRLPDSATKLIAHSEWLLRGMHSYVMKCRFWPKAVVQKDFPCGLEV